MFGLFNRKKSDYKKDVILMQNIFNLLPDNFEFIKKQLDEGLIIGSEKSNKPIDCYTKFTYDIKLLNKLEDKKGRYFGIRGVYVLDSETNELVELQINIGYGILISYFGIKVNFFSPVVDNIKINNFRIMDFSDDNYDSIKDLLSINEKKLINTTDVYEVKLKGKSYYHLKDLEDGDFIGIDKDKKVYKITHDPFEIILLQGELLEILNDTSKL